MLIRALLLSTILASGALAATNVCGGESPMDEHDPVCKGPDNRIRTFLFNPGLTMRIMTAGLTPVRIIFSSAEQIDAVIGNTVSGEKEAPNFFWARSGNSLTLQPRHLDIQTSTMFVTTTINDANPHNYVIELGVGSGDATNPRDDRAYTQVSIVDPKAVASAAVAGQKQRIVAAQAKVIAAKLEEARANAAINKNYSMQDDGCKKLAPRRGRWVWDDNQQTIMLFPQRKPAPAMFERDLDDPDPDNEVLIKTTSEITPEGQKVTLPSVYPAIVLRRGNYVCLLRNDSYSEDAPVPGGASGTASPYVMVKARTP